MKHRTPPQPKVKAIPLSQSNAELRKPLALTLLTSLMILASALTLRAEEIITSYGYSTFGELKYGPDFEHLDYVNPDAPKGGEIAQWARGTFDSMNPFSRKGRAGSLSSMPYERLMTSTDDDPYGYYCIICESLEYPKSEDWVIFHLRDDVKFADGSGMTAHDVKFTVDLLLEQALPSFREAVSKLYDSVEVIDDYKIKFTFAEGIPRKALIIQAGATIVFSKAWFEETGARLDESRLLPTMGTGPYVVDETVVNRRIVYKRNPDYWGADLPINRGRFNFDTIRIEYFSDETAALEGFKSGAYTFRQETSSLSWATGYDFSKVTNGQVIKKELENGNLPAANGFVFNLRRDKFSDLRVRQALSLMYNFTWTNETLQYGLFKQRHSFWENTDLAAQGVPEGAELALLEKLGDKLDPSIITEPVVMAHESSARQLDRRNLRKATALLQDAGWAPDANGMLTKDGQRFELEFLGNSSNSSIDRIVQPYIENLKRLGIDARFERVDPSQYTNRERDFDWDMIFDGYTNGLSEALGISQRYGSDGVGDVFNPAGYSSEAVDLLIEDIVDATTLDEMKTGIRAVDRVLRHAQFMVPTWFLDSYWVAYYDMFEHPENMPPYALGQLDFWWYNADKAEALKAAGAL